jgi:hypothetical protein
MIGFIVAAALAVASGLETIGDPKTYHDHGWAFYVFGADFVLLALVVVIAFRQTRVNKDLQRQLDAAESGRDELARRLGHIEGIAKERGERLRFLMPRLQMSLERSVILRDCDDDHEKRISKIEDRLMMAREKAVARLALRGMAFDEAALEPTPEEGEQK